VDFGSFAGGWLTGLREGVEAALIVAIVLAYLARTGNGVHASKVWLGAGSAIVLSLVLGIVIYQSIGSLEEPWEQVFEGVAMLIAAAVVTWMLFWMRRYASQAGRELRAAVDRALDTGSAWGLAVLAFTAVIREGLETSLFLVGQAQSAETAAGSVVIGAILGLAVAALIGAAIYRGSRHIDLGVFFRWTGVALVFIAAGLLSHAIHEFIEIGLITVGTSTAFDISAVLSHDDGIGQFLRAILGYSASPEVTTLVVHLAYLVIVLVLYLRPSVPATPRGNRPQPAS
jgi:high-affinity iron transporter